MKSAAPPVIATVDVGTNTALLLVASVYEGRLHIYEEAERFVRLGKGVAASGRISPAAMHRLRSVLLDYRARAELHGAQQIIVAGTSASRDAHNRAELIAFVRRETGLDYEILTGEVEAALSFLGATSAFSDLHGPCAVIDIGGGSTELIVGEARGAVTALHSIDAGAVRLTERFWSTPPPDPAAIRRAAAHVRSLLDASGLVLDPAVPLIGAAGTVTALACVRDGVAAVRDNTAALTRADVQAWRERLLQLACDQVLALNPAVMQGRADVFPAGVLILDEVMDRFDLPACRVSPRGVRHGLALRSAIPS